MCVFEAAVCVFEAAVCVLEAAGGVFGASGCVCVAAVGGRGIRIFAGLDMQSAPVHG